jgi:hypothetical protein
VVEDVVVRKCASVLQLLAGEDETLLVRWDTFLILDLLFHLLDGVRGLNFKSDCLAGQCLHEDLHATTETKDKVKGRVFLDVLVRKCASVRQILARKE